MSLLIWLFVFNSFSNLIDCDRSQKNIESNAEETIRVLVNNVEKENNALREARIMRQYYSDMNKILCIGTSLIFEGKVWSIEFDSTSFVLRIGSNNGDTFFPFFYNYYFYENDGLADQIAQLSKGDLVKFNFNFIDTYTTDSEHYIDNLLTENPDTGNKAMMFYIDLNQIEKKDQ